MDNSTITLKPVKELVGMSFYIPDYQRGYRWLKQQATDFLEDIWAFTNDIHKSDDEIYCIQPLVVQRKTDKNLLENIRNADTIHKVESLLKGSWNVVDGQQRLTTIYLILSALGVNHLYSIEYQTRDGSRDYLENIDAERKLENIDFYHMYQVHATIKEWFDSKCAADRDKFKKTLLEQVQFIWYRIQDEISDNDRTEAISAFTRLNIGKIPLTDSELIKALFLNRSNFDCTPTDFEKQQLRIATEWDEIEFALQNDEFWLFLHSPAYNKPTRIDFILDMIFKSNEFKLDKEIYNKIAEDDHSTFRYFYSIFSNNKLTINSIWLNQKWTEIRKYYQIFKEWYCDYKLYHYVGFLTTIQEDRNPIPDLAEKWRDGLTLHQNSGKSPIKCREKLSPTKNHFLKYIRSLIYHTLPKDPTGKLIDLDTAIFDEEHSGSMGSKRKCVPLLLLHNIETLIQQNDKLLQDQRYGLPNFTKFPFHLYKKERWDVEHIRPNAGSKIHSEESQRVYALLAKKYIGHKLTEQSVPLTERIAEYDSGNITFDDLLEDILKIDQSITETDKNKIWNYTLLDSTTNKEYSNAIFPIKRAFIANKEQGYKITYKAEKGAIHTEKTQIEVAFVPPCTRNVFAKFYTDVPDDMLEWTRIDAENYLEDIKTKLCDYRNYREETPYA